VGGCAALVEWGMFYLFASVCGLHYLLAATLAFIVSTTVNLVLGKLISFRDSDRYEGKTALEAILVFAVSAAGLLFNLALMFLFVQVLKMNTDFLMILSKICATSIVFIWNFLIRKLVIYRE
jgi:putative flippase GtrA